jgi:hypothetical protein
MRLTDSEKAKELTAKTNKTLEDKIYISLAHYETEELYTKTQLNLAIKKTANILAKEIGEKLIDYVALGIASELKHKSINEQVSMKEVYQVCNEVVKRCKK